MKTTNQTTKRITAGMLLALIFLVTTSSFAHDSTDSNVGNKPEKSIEEYIEPLESDIALQMVVLNIPPTVSILDENNNIIYEAQKCGNAFDPVLEILLRRADYLIEVDGNTYYRIYENKSTFHAQALTP